MTFHCATEWTPARVAPYPSCAPLATLRPCVSCVAPPPTRSAVNQKKNAAKSEGAGATRNVPQAPTALFFRYNTSLGPPYQVLLDTNFINFSIKNKLDIVRAGMDCLLAKVVPCVTDCVLAELEKLGPKYRVALRIAKDPRFERIPCEHRGTYADDCLVNRVSEVRGRLPP